MKKLLTILLLAVVVEGCETKSKEPASVWIDSWHPKDSSRSGRYYNDCIKLNDRQYLFVGKDGFGNTFDSTIITINP